MSAGEPVTMEKIEGLGKACCTVVAICACVMLITALLRNTACDELVWCSSAKNGSVIYKGIIATCVAKPEESWPCEWYVEEPCPVRVSCDERGRYNLLTLIIWIALFTLLICCTMACCVAIAAARYETEPESVELGVLPSKTETYIPAKGGDLQVDS